MSGLLRGPGRAILVLSITQVLGWGILIYPPVLTLPQVTAAHGWSLAFGMAGFSLGLVVSALLAPTIGGLIDRHGGNVVMGAGALAGAAGLASLAVAEQRWSFLSSWVLIGAAMASTLYDPAFATLARLFGTGARRPITYVTLAGGFASTAGWPATQWLLQHLGWQSTYLAFAAVLLLVVAPLHALALPRHPSPPPPVMAGAHPAAAAAMPAPIKPQGRPFWLIVAAFALYAFILSGVTSNLLAMLQRGGLSAAAAVNVGALFGPAQVAARLIDLTLAGRSNPLWVARGAVLVIAAAFALLLALGQSFAVAAAFAIAFGAANGVMTIARGALPLMLFGASGYGRVIGRIARPALFVQAAAPFLVALAVEQFSDRVVLELALLGAIAALACLLALNSSKAR
ncbi:MFS transporter [Rhodopseudomonas pseudopalustris]|uniref:MFS transporter n=1 Tax=Rhodopseudomonas pseudopalustris TaxID=1513892 RepID=UPI003F95969B